jgi:hypothetical protein
MNSNKERAASHQIALHGWGENDKTSSIHFYKKQRDLTQDSLNKSLYRTIENDSELFVIEAPNGCIPSPFSSFFGIFTTIYGYFKPKSYQWYSDWNPFAICLEFSASKKKICKHINKLIGINETAPIFLHGYAQGSSMCIESLKWLPKNAVVEELHLITAYYIKDSLSFLGDFFPLTRSFIYWWIGATDKIDFEGHYKDMKIYYTVIVDDDVVCLSQGEQMIGHLIHMGAKPSNIFIRFFSATSLWPDHEDGAEIGHQNMKPFARSKFICWDDIDNRFARAEAYGLYHVGDYIDENTLRSDFSNKYTKDRVPKIDDSGYVRFYYIFLLIEIVFYLLVVAWLFFLTQMLFSPVCTLIQCLKLSTSSVL